MRIEARGIYYKDLNEKIREALNNRVKEIILDNVNGQRYIGDGLSDSNIKIIINGIPGNDLAAFMDGPTIIVNSNTQDGIGNTMNAGKVIVYGDAGDIVGHSIRGGKIYIEGDVGYRVGIHMKAYQDLYPVIIIGGTARDFLGEYMAGGLIIVLGLNKEEDVPIVGSYVGTGMHSGRIYIRGKVEDYQLGKEINLFELDEDDRHKLSFYLKEYCQDFNLNLKEILKDKFVKLIPSTHRPYGSLYAY
jgi:glutamate synthase domain-containing protein 3